METVISKSGKRRQGPRYIIENRQPKTILDKLPSDWKQIVILTDSGTRRRNGKPAMISKTRHLRDN
jgi:hypothetical protein